MVLGAGRGPLVRATFNAADITNNKVKVCISTSFINIMYVDFLQLTLNTISTENFILSLVFVNRLTTLTRCHTFRILNTSVTLGRFRDSIKARTA